MKFSTKHVWSNSQGANLQDMLLMSSPQPLSRTDETSLKDNIFHRKKTPLPQNESDKARQLSDEVTKTEELHQREKCIKQRTFEYITGNHRKLQVWASPFSRYMLFTSFHRIILYADWEGTHQDHWVPTPSPVQHTPRIPPCAQEGCPNTPWPLSGLALWPLPWGTCSSAEPFSGWWTFSQYPT